MKLYGHRGPDCAAALQLREAPSDLWLAELLPRVEPQKLADQVAWESVLVGWFEAYGALTKESPPEVCASTDGASVASFACRHALRGVVAIPDPTAPIRAALEALRRNDAARRENVVLARRGRAPRPLEPTPFDAWLTPEGTLVGAALRDLAVSARLLVFRYSDLGVSAVVVASSPAELGSTLDALAARHGPDWISVVAHRDLPTQ